MFDTTKLKHYRRVLENYDFQNEWKLARNTKYKTWVHNPEKGVALPRLAIYRTERLWHIEAEVSVPKMLFGHNARLLNQNDRNDGLQFISDYVEAHSGLPFNAETATVARVDFVRDFELLKSEVMPTLKKLSAQTISRTDKLFYNDECLYFKALAKTRLIRIYDKLRQVLNSKTPNPEAIEYAQNKLRIEFCLLKTDAINRLVNNLSLPDKTAQSILNQNVADYAVNEVLDILQFTQILSNDKPLFELLRETFGTRKAMNLFGFLEAVSLYGEQFYKDESFDFSEHSYKRESRNCKKAKVWKIPKTNK